MKVLERAAVLAILLAAAKPGGGQQPRSLTIYRSIELATFSVSPDASSANVPPEDWRVLIETELVKRLKRLEGCELVAKESSRADLPEPSLRLVGTFTKFKLRSRKSRTFGSIAGTVAGGMVGGMAGGIIGRTVVEAHVKFLDRNTGAVLAEGDVLGESLDAAREFASDVVVQIVQKKFFACPGPAEAGKTTMNSLCFASLIVVQPNSAHRGD